MTARAHSAAPDLTFDWCTTQWEDPLTGTQVVKLSPDQPLHFRNAYFRTPIFTPDGRTMLMAGHDPQAVPPEWGGAGCCKPNGQTAGLFAVDLLTGATEAYPAVAPGENGLWYAAAARDRVAHLIVNCGGHEEIERLELDTGRRRRIRPSEPLRLIFSAETSADAMFLYTGAPWPADGPADEAAWSAYLHERNSMFRIDLETGETNRVLDYPWALTHALPNPVEPGLLLSGNRQPYHDPGCRPVLVRDLTANRWIDLPWPSRCGLVSHPMWTADGRSIYGHAGFLGYQTISRARIETGQWESFVVPIGAGDSAHVHVAPDESFLVGDGKNWGWNTEDEAPVSIGNGFDFDGVGCHSPGEVIWKFELPRETILTPDHKFRRRDDLLAPINRHPDKAVRTTPVCRFRSLSRLHNLKMRLESNAQVTPDSRWVVFQSCSEQGLFEIWAARVPEAVSQRRV